MTRDQIEEAVVYHYDEILHQIQMKIYEGADRNLGISWKVKSQIYDNVRDKSRIFVATTIHAYLDNWKTRI